MNNSAIPLEIYGALQGLGSSIETMKCDLLNNPPCENDSFDENSFWEKLVQCADALSHEALKLCLLFDDDSSLPTTRQFEATSKCIENVTKKFVLIYLEFPDAQGKFLRQALFQHVSSIVDALIHLCNEPLRERRLRLTERISQSCKSFNKLPHSNKDAVLEVFHNETSVIEDAKEELADEARDPVDHGMREETLHAFMQNGISIEMPIHWTVADHVAIQPCLKLVEIYITCLKRITKMIERSICDDIQAVAQLDEVGDSVKGCSAFVDDLVSSFYPPTSHSAILHYASEVKTKISDLLTFLESAYFSSQSESLFANLFRDATETCWQQIHQDLSEE